MLPYLEESRVKKSQLQRTLFRSEPVIPFNCGLSIVGGSFHSSHKYINHKFLALAIKESKAIESHN